MFLNVRAGTQRNLCAIGIRVWNLMHWPYAFNTCAQKKKIESK